MPFTHSFSSQFEQLCLGPLLCWRKVSFLISFFDTLMQQKICFTFGWPVTVRRAGMCYLASWQSGGFRGSRFPDSLSEI